MAAMTSFHKKPKAFSFQIRSG